MDRIYIITNHTKDKNNEITLRIKHYIEEKGKQCILSEKDEVGNILPDTIPKNLDCAIVLGGDGTLIQSARELRNYDIPLLGVNLGTLGYLADLEVQYIEPGIDALFEDKPMFEERMMLKGMINECREDIALNDVVVTRLGELRVIHFNVYVNGELLNAYQADGVIISTPTGSTGYNLSAGGPIVEPTASLIVITPICSHALNTSSIVLSDADEIIIELGKGRNGRDEIAGVSFDGTELIHIKTGDCVKVRKAKETTKFMKLSRVSFLETLRRKMKGN